MSLNNLAQQFVDRRTALATNAIAVAAGQPATATTPTREDALSALAKYIPTEVVTIYLFALSAIGAAKTWPADAVWWLYGALLVFTPVCFWLILAGKYRTADPAKAWPTLRAVPWFRLVAATIGFAVWAPAVPKSEMLAGDAGLLIGVAALAVSTLLSLLEPVFEPG